MVTIKDVARESGLAVGTVSRYLNGESVKTKNREQIEAAIQKLGYRPNTLARSMKTRRSMTIAVVVPKLANMFCMRIIESIERVLDGEGYSVIIADCGSDEVNQIAKITMLKNRMVDGFVLMPTGSDAESVRVAAGDVPVVLIDRLMQPRMFDSIVVNNCEATYSLVKKAVARGITKIGIIEGPQQVYSARERLRGFNAAMEAFGLDNSYHEQGTYTFESGYLAMKNLLKHDLEAVFASNYELSLGAIDAVNDKNANVTILGFDSIELLNTVKQPYIFISQPVEEIGKRAAELLLERIKNPNGEKKHIVLEI